MVFYSAPVTPVVTKARVDKAALNDATPAVNLNQNLPDPDTSGEWGAGVGGVQQLLGSALGSARISKPYNTLTSADCENVIMGVGDVAAGSDSTGTTGNFGYSFRVDNQSIGNSAVGAASLPAYLLPEWPTQYGASLEDRPASEGGPWNPYDDDPNADPPATATGWEIVEPGRLVGAHLVEFFGIQSNTSSTSDVTQYVTLGQPRDFGNWAAIDAQSGNPVLDEWAIPGADAKTYWRTVELDPAALPGTGYCLTNLYRKSDPANSTPWLWRGDPNQNIEGKLDGSLSLVVAFRWQPPVYRWILSGPAPTPGLPPLRQSPRDDQYGTSSAARIWPPPSSRQSGLRRLGGVDC